MSNKKYITNIRCKLCDKQLSTGWSKYRIFVWFKSKIIKRKHIKENHTIEEVRNAYILDEILNSGKWRQRK